MKLLVNDANYDQVTHDQAVEQWILQGVDGGPFLSCRFQCLRSHTCQVKRCKNAVVAGNSPLTDSEVDSVFTIDNVEELFEMYYGRMLEGYMAGK